MKKTARMYATCFGKARAQVVKINQSYGAVFVENAHTGTGGTKNGEKIVNFIQFSKSKNSKSYENAANAKEMVSKKFLDKGMTLCYNYFTTNLYTSW